jgi:hydroxymethylpyrimidine pyrophosphatase-like HAD family hydrolase
MAPLAYAVDGARTVLLHGGAENEATARYLEALGALHRCQRDDHGGAVAALPVLNMLLLDDPQRLRAFLGARCGRGSGLSATLSKSAYTTGLGVAELQAADASKATAALALAREHGVGAADIVAFGDNLNDLELLLAAGEARCPPDAAPEVLAAIAGRIAPTAEEGVARYLEELLAEAR